MRASELRGKADAELEDELIGLRREQFNLRMQQATGQLVRSDQYRKIRRNIARIKTVLSERTRERTEAGK